MTTRSGILARVSTQGQKGNSSHEAQIERCREYCIQHGYQVVMEKREIMSGSLVLARSDYNALLKADLDVIVVDIPDRLGRGDAIAQCEMLARINNKRVEYAQPGRDTSTIEGYVQHSAEQMVSGVERLNIRRRTKDGKDKWAKMGRVIAPSRRPYGYRIVRIFDTGGRKTDCTLEIVPDEADVVRLVYKLYTVDGLSMSAISRRLTEKNVPKISNYDPDHQKRRKNPLDAWSTSTIQRILESTTYKGEWRHNRLQSKSFDTPQGVKVKVTNRRTDEATIVPVPAIVTAKQWALAAHLRAKNKERFMRRTTHTFTLRNRLTCALCNSKYHCTTYNETRDRGYICSHSKTAYKHDHEKACDAGSISARKIEGPVWETVCEEMQNLDAIHEALLQREAINQETRQMIEQSILATNTQIENEKISLDRWLELVGRGLMTADQYAEKKAQVDDRIQRLNDSIDTFRAQLDDMPMFDEAQMQAIEEFQRSIGDRLHPDVDLERQAALYNLLDLECLYDAHSRKMVIRGLFGERMLSIPSSRYGWYFGFTATLQLLVEGGFARLGCSWFGRPGQDQGIGLPESIRL